MGVLYTRLPDSLSEQIREAAEADDRPVAAWVRAHFREYFAEKERQCADGSSRTHSSPPE